MEGKELGPLRSLGTRFNTYTNGLVHTREGRSAINSAALLVAEGIVKYGPAVDPKAYFEQVSQPLSDTLQTIGLNVTPEFFQWHLTSFVGALAMLHLSEWSGYFLIPDQIEILAKAKHAFESHPKLYSSFIVASYLTLGEIIHGSGENRSFDTQDMVAYAASIFCYIASEPAYKLYLQFKHEHGGDIKGFLQKYGNELKKQFQEPDPALQDFFY